jgi:hypothetical protein
MRWGRWGWREGGRFYGLRESNRYFPAMTVERRAAPGGEHVRCRAAVWVLQVRARVDAALSCMRRVRSIRPSSRCVASDRAVAMSAMEGGAPQVGLQGGRESRCELQRAEGRGAKWLVPAMNGNGPWGSGFGAERPIPTPPLVAAGSCSTTRSVKIGEEILNLRNVVYAQH